MDAESQEIRFGVIAVKKGFLTPEQIVKALEIQVKENLKIGQHRLLGTILMAQNILTQTQLDEVLQDLK